MKLTRYINYDHISQIEYRPGECRIVMMGRYTHVFRGSLAKEFMGKFHGYVGNFIRVGDEDSGD